MVETRKVARSAKSGEFVSKAAAKAKPSTTVTETVKATRPAKKAPLVDTEALKAEAEAKRAAEADYAKRLDAARHAFFEGHPKDTYAGITREEAGPLEGRRVGA
jgi:hypothetical protein